MEEEKTIATLIKCITNEYEKSYNQALSSFGITTSQCAVLNYLFETDREYVNQKDIENHLNLSNPTVTGLLKRLDEKGYVLIVPNNQDRRKKNVHLTEQAFDMQRKIDNIRRKMDRSLLRGMKKRDADCVQRYLEKMLYNIES